MFYLRYGEESPRTLYVDPSDMYLYCRINDSPRARQTIYVALYFSNVGSSPQSWRADVPHVSSWGLRKVNGHITLLCL